MKSRSYFLHGGLGWERLAVSYIAMQFMQQAGVYQERRNDSLSWACFLVGAVLFLAWGVMWYALGRFDGENNFEPPDYHGPERRGQ
jgi:hypothetical protein